MIKTLYQRATSKTPPFWRWVRNICGVLGILSLIASKLPIADDEWRYAFQEIAEYLLPIAGVSQFATTNRALSEKEVKLKKS